MQFSVGDKVVHPSHGPGLITGIENRDLMDGQKRYYVIEMRSRGFTVHVPVLRADEGGMRLAISQSGLPSVLSMLSGAPQALPEDYRERQEQIGAQLRTGQVKELAGVIRDLTWHGERAHLTKKDSDYLKQGRELLAAEMALASGDDVMIATQLIRATMTAAVASVVH